MFESSQTSFGAVRRELRLEVPEAEVFSRSESDCFDSHRLSVQSARSQAETQCSRSPAAFSPISHSDYEDSILSDGETRDAFSNEHRGGRDRMWLDSEDEPSSQGESMDSFVDVSYPARVYRSSSVPIGGSLCLRSDLNSGSERPEQAPQRTLGIRTRSEGAPFTDVIAIEDRKKLKTDSSTGSVGEIAVETMAEMLCASSRLRELYDHVYVIDCRYQYEFDGGHISERAMGDWLSVHHFMPHQAEEAVALLFGDAAQLKLNDDRVCVILHCEFSQKRGPAMFEKLRSHDRALNIRAYPQLYFPEMYVMKGGYKAFFEQGYTAFCEPPSYVPETDVRFTKECKLFHRLGRTKSGGKGRHLCTPPAPVSPLQ